jgi:hypothetical protein
MRIAVAYICYENNCVWTLHCKITRNLHCVTTHLHLHCVVPPP